MKRVVASRLTHDAAVGRVEPGQEYLIEDDKADRWIEAGIATEAPPKPDPQPEPPQPPQPEPAPSEEGEDEDEESDEDEDGGEGEEKDDEELASEAHKLHDEGLSERAIAQQMGISRSRVHRLLMG